MTQRTVPAAGTKRPETTGVASAFSLGGQPAKLPRAKAVPIDPAAIVIRKGVPVPPKATNTGRGELYAALLARMKPGDSCEVAKPLAVCIASYAKKAGIGLTLRKLGDGQVGIWLNKK